jgi:hypothetical protein
VLLRCDDLDVEDRLEPSLNDIDPAILNAISDESTSW